VIPFNYLFGVSCQNLPSIPLNSFSVNTQNTHPLRSAHAVNAANFASLIKNSFAALLNFLISV